MDIVKVNNVSKDYYQYKVFMRGKMLTRALKNVSFDVKKGDFFGLLGKNGAGKSTMLKILTTNLEKTSGKVYINGYDMDKNEDEIKENISWMFGVDYDGVGWSSVEKNLMLAASFLGLKKGESEQRAKELLHYFGLYKHRKLDVWRMSTGMQGKYSLCVAMLKDPKVLFLDEPLLGLDFEAKEQLGQILKKLNEEEGTTIIYTDQQLREVEKHCKNVVIIDHGSKVYDGPMQRLKEKYRDADVIELRCRSSSLNAVLHQLQKKYSFVSDYDVLDSRDNVHEGKLYTKVDGAKVLLKIGNFLNEKKVVVEKLNAGLLDLEDIFRKFLHKDTAHDKAHRLMHYHTAGEKPSKEHEQYLKDKNYAIRGAACKAFVNYQDIDRILMELLSLSKVMKIEALKVIGDAKLRHLAENIYKDLKGKDRELQLHLALALGKIGDENIVDTLLGLLLDYHTCFEVLEHLPKLEANVMHRLQEKASQLSRSDHHFLVYQTKKMKNCKELLELLHIREDNLSKYTTKQAAYLTRYGKIK